MESRQECRHTFMSSCFLINLSAPFHCHLLKQLIWSCCQSLFLMVKYNTVRGEKRFGLDWCFLSPPLPTVSLQVLSLKADSKATMDPLWFSTLVVIILACIARPSLGCPSGCRCYSLTVECGSLGLKEIPQGVPSVTEVSRPIDIVWGH